MENPSDKQATATEKQQAQSEEKQKSKSPSPSSCQITQADANPEDPLSHHMSSPSAAKKLKTNQEEEVVVNVYPEIPVQNVQVNEKVLVDEYVPKREEYKIIEINGEVFSVTLNMTDTQDEDQNKFYLIQVFVNENTKEYFEYNRWGRIGYEGKEALKGPMSVSKAIHDFNSQKTVKLSQGYLQIFIDYDDQEEEKEEQKQMNQPVQLLQKEVQILIGKIFNGKMMENSIKDIGYDPKKMPLGQLADRTIKEAYKALDQLQKAMKINDTQQIKIQTNKFFTLIPHDIGFKKTSQVLVLNTQQQILSKLDMLKNLTDMKVAAKMMKNQVHTPDLQLYQSYLKLNNTIKLLDRKSEDFQIIEELIQKTQGHYQLSIQNIYTLDRMGETARFKKDIGNDFLLWHGSRMSNFVGILSQGLRIAPPEAPVNGYNYGQGVYFADLLQKSTDYTGYSSTNGDILLLLCQVAVGKPNVLVQTNYNANQLPEGCNSTLGWGTRAPDEAENKYIDDGKTRVPIGTLIQTKSTHWMGANQYIIYNEAQSRMRFLVNLQVENKGY